MERERERGVRNEQFVVTFGEGEDALKSGAFGKRILGGRDRREEKNGLERRGGGARESRERERRVDRRTSNRTGIFVCPLFRPCFFFPSFFFFFFFPLVERALAALRRVEKKARFFPRYTSVLFALWNACYR